MPGSSNLKAEHKVFFKDIKVASRIAKQFDFNSQLVDLNS